MGKVELPPQIEQTSVDILTVTEIAQKLNSVIAYLKEKEK